MRLLNTLTFEVSENSFDAESEQYAILSHRWRPGEITLQGIKSANLYDGHKIKRACAKARAREPRLEWLWIDTCCIDKTNAVETAAAINSMFDLYRRATVCYAYLDDVVKSKPGRSEQQMFERQEQKRPNQQSEWFERGWTLQELLAPNVNMEFYDRDWEMMGTKQQLASLIQSLTGIEKTYLNGEADFMDASVATRMSWMAGRFTTKPEDIAYSLLGIFDINLTIQYGEGVKAFMGLQKALIENSTDESIFAWTVPTRGLQCYQGQKGIQNVPQWVEREWGLLAPSPDCFKDSNDLVIPPRDKIVVRPGGGYTWTQQGIQFQLPMVPGGEGRNLFGLPRKDVTLSLNCWKPVAGGQPLTVQIRLLKRNGAYVRTGLNNWELKKGAKPGSNKSMGVDQVLTMPLVITQPVFRL